MLPASLSPLAMPSAVWAHGIHSEAENLSILGFIRLGIEHMLLGWDHLLFVAGVLLIAGNARRAAKLISIFALGHSITLIVATLAGWQVSAEAVDMVIAFSVAFVGAVAVMGQPARWSVFAAIVLIFGLIHGLGLSTRFQELGLPEEGLIWKVIAFNVGVEIGQLMAILIMVAIGAAASKMIDLREPARREKATRLAAVALVVIGVVATPLVAYRSIGTSETATGPSGGS